MVSNTSDRRIKRTCPVCARQFEASVNQCPQDGILLVDGDPLIGTLFDNRYEVVDYVGQGGMGVVYKAWHRQLERFVAIKLMKPQPGNDVNSLKRFQREARAASQMQHPNVNAVYAFGVTTEGRPYLILEYLDGKSLATILGANQRYPLDGMIALFSQLASGLAHAHLHGVIHRDIKPSNILVVQQSDGTNLAKIVDFGTAKLRTFQMMPQDLTQSGEVLGTLMYMSPEQKVGAEADERSDLYAVGCMLHEALSGQSELPERMTQVISKATAENPDNRYQTADALKIAIDDVMKKSAQHSTAVWSLASVMKNGALLFVVLIFVIIGSLLLMRDDILSSRMHLAYLRLTHAPPKMVLEQVVALAGFLEGKGELKQAREIYSEFAPLSLNVDALTRSKFLAAYGTCLSALGKDSRADELLSKLALEDGSPNLSMDERREINRVRVPLQLVLLQKLPASKSTFRKYFELGKSYRLNGFNSEAKEMLLASKKRIEANPRFRNLFLIEGTPELVSAYANLGEALTGKQVIDDAIQVLEKAGVAPDALIHWYARRAAILYKLGRLDESIAEYDKTIALSRRHHLPLSVVLIERAAAANDKHRGSEALAFLRDLEKEKSDLSTVNQACFYGELMRAYAPEDAAEAYRAARKFVQLTSPVDFWDVGLAPYVEIAIHKLANHNDRTSAYAYARGEMKKRVAHDCRIDMVNPGSNLSDYLSHYSAASSHFSETEADYLEALKTFKGAIRKAEVATLLSDLYLLGGENEKAQSFLQQAVKIAADAKASPEFIQQFQEKLGAYYLSRHQTVAAAELYDEMFRAGGERALYVRNYMPATLHAVEAFNANGDYNKSAELLRAVLNKRTELNIDTKISERDHLRDLLADAESRADGTESR